MILINASAAGIFPMPLAEVYSVAKAGAAHLARSLGYLDAEAGVRVCALCPRFADTAMVHRMMARGEAVPRPIQCRTRLLWLFFMPAAPQLLLPARCTHLTHLPSPPSIYHIHRSFPVSACPQKYESDTAGKLLDAVGGKLLSMGDCVSAALTCLADTDNAGRCYYLEPEAAGYW